MVKKMKVWDYLAITLLIIGGLNWGLVGLFNFDLVVWLANNTFEALKTILYVLVGASAIYTIFRFPK